MSRPPPGVEIPEDLREVVATVNGWLEARAVLWDERLVAQKKAMRAKLWQERAERVRVAVEEAEREWAAAATAHRHKFYSPENSLCKPEEWKII